MSPRLERNPESKKQSGQGLRRLSSGLHLYSTHNLWGCACLLACFKTEYPLHSQNWHQTFDLASLASQGLRFYTCAPTTGKFIFCARVCVYGAGDQTQARLYSRQVICLSAVFPVALAPHTRSVLALTKHSNVSHGTSLVLCYNDCAISLSHFPGALWVPISRLIYPVNHPHAIVVSDTSQGVWEESRDWCPLGHRHKDILRPRLSFPC